MKIIAQEVKYAICKKDEKIFSVIGYGVVVYIGICDTDNDLNIDFLAKKLLKIRLYDGWTKTIRDNNYDMLIIYEKSLSVENDKAEEIYNDFMEKLKANYTWGIVRGVPFNGKFSVSICNQGPATFILNK